jgi:hypothetical protein
VNQNNIGYDFNLLTIMNLASGKYVKLLADDDILENTYLENLIKSIKSEDFDILINNFAFFNSDLSLNLVESWFANNDLQYFEKNIKQLDAISHAYGQVSSLTFKREKVLSLAVPKHKSNHINVYWFFSLFLHSKIVLEDDILIKVRQGSPNFSGSKIGDKITPLGGIRALIDSDLSDKTLKKELIDRQKNYCLHQLSSLSNHSFVSRITISRKFISYFKYSFKFWFFWLPFTLMPNRMRKYAKSVRKTISLKRA